MLYKCIIRSSGVSLSDNSFPLCRAARYRENVRKCHSPYLRCCGRSTYTPDGLPARTTYPGGKWKELVYDSNRNVTNILHTARSTPNTSLSFDAFGNITNAIDTAGNAWQFSYTHNSTLTNEVFTSLRLCDSARQTNTPARLLDADSRPIGYDLTIGATPRSRTRYGYDNEGRIATLAATNAANRGFQVTYLNEAGYNYGYTLTTPNGATLTRTVTRDPYRRSLTLDCTTRFNNVVVASFAYTFDAHSRPVARNNDRFAYNDRDEITSALIGTNRINRAYDTIGNHVFCAYNSATNFYANNQLNQTTASYVCAPSVGSADNDAPPLFNGYDILSTNKLAWSAQGGLQRDGRFIYAFDAEDQLVSVTSSTLSNGAIRVVNAYDYRHRRISKTVYTMRDDSPPTSPLAPPSPISHRSWHLQERHDFVYASSTSLSMTILVMLSSISMNQVTQLLLTPTTISAKRFPFLVPSPCLSPAFFRRSILTKKLTYTTLYRSR